MIGKPSLILALAGTAGLSVIAHASVLAETPPPTRMGVSIQQSIQERDKAAARRNRALDLREQTARAAEERLKAGLEGRQETQARSTEGGQDPVDDQFESLARIYQAMKPAKAAKVFEQLELDVQMRVAQRMRDRSTAMILAAMNPGAAAKLSMALARRGSPASPRPPAQRNK